MALDISEACRIPAWVAKLCPENPSCATVPPGFTPSAIGWLNYARSLWYWVTVAIALVRIGANAKSEVCRRRFLGLGPTVSKERIAEMTYTPMLLGFSRHLFPKPTDYDAWAFEVGFWQVQVRAALEGCCTTASPLTLPSFSSALPEPGRRGIPCACRRRPARLPRLVPGGFAWSRGGRRRPARLSFVSPVRREEGRVGRMAGKVRAFLALFQGRRADAWVAAATAAAAAAAALAATRRFRSCARDPPPCFAPHRSPTMALATCRALATTPRWRPCPLPS